MRISGILYSIKQGLINIWRNKLFSTASIATMTACIFLFGLFYAIVANFQSMVRDVEKGVAITVFFDEDASEEQIQAIGQAIKMAPGVLDQNYVSADAAWEEFKNRLHKHKFETGRTYTATQSCYLRKSAGTGKNTVPYCSLSDAVRKKCRNALGPAVFRKGKTFRLMKVLCSGEDAWGQMKSGYWVPLVYKGKVRAEMK